jgi:AcrR family transcriptional regulator
MYSASVTSGENGERDSRRGPARQRIVDAAYELFSRRGIRDVGVDELIQKSGVAKATFYKHFKSKDEVVLAYLQRWYEERTQAIAQAVARYGNRDGGAVLTIFDVFDDWFQQGAVQVSSFLHVLMEMGPEHPLGKAAISYLEQTRQQVADLAESAGLTDAHEFAWSIHILCKGAIVADAEGDLHAAQRARRMARILVDHHRQ